MSTLQRIALKLVRWTGWLLIPVLLVFFGTGYAMTGQYGFAALTDERTALAIHRLMHVPLGALVLAHLVPSTFLAVIRWGWIKPHP